MIKWILKEEEIMINSNMSNTYHKVVKVVNKYNLISPGDKIAVEVSADKNSYMLMQCLRKFQQEADKNFEIEYFVVEKDNKNSSQVEEILKAYEIHKYHSVKEENVEEIYTMIEEVGCNVIALPINYNDILNLTFMTLMERKKAPKIYPKSVAKESKSIEVIRPLCIVEDKDIVKDLKNMKMEITEDTAIFGKLSYIEEGIHKDKCQNSVKYHFSVYEGL